MSFWEAVLFGLVQGLTEFLPVSSTAHIVLVSYATGLHFPGLSFEIFLHLASLLAVAAYFRRDLWFVIKGFVRFPLTRGASDPVPFRFGCYIVIATVITGVLGLTLNHFAGASIKHPWVVASGFFGTACFLLWMDRIQARGKRQLGEIRTLDAVMIGIGQAISVVPGVSRSGSTLIVALLLGLERETAVRFSFLLAMPVILGSTVLMVPHFQEGMLGEVGWFPLAVSFLVSLIATWVGIVWLISFLRRSRLFWFSVYLFILSGTLFFLHWSDPERITFEEPLTVIEDSIHLDHAH
jgi:undecaprenyl-diphosphatase